VEYREAVCGAQATPRKTIMATSSSVLNERASRPAATKACLKGFAIHVSFRNWRVLSHDALQRIWIMSEAGCAQNTPRRQLLAKSNEFGQQFRTK
jgi:hypothetical protein